MKGTEDAVLCEMKVGKRIGGLFHCHLLTHVSGVIPSTFEAVVRGLVMREAWFRRKNR